MVQTCFILHSQQGNQRNERAHAGHQAFVRERGTAQGGVRGSPACLHACNPVHGPTRELTLFSALCSRSSWRIVAALFVQVRQATLEVQYAARYSRMASGGPQAPPPGQPMGGYPMYNSPPGAFPGYPGGVPAYPYGPAGPSAVRAGMMGAPKWAQQGVYVLAVSPRAVRFCLQGIGVGRYMRFYQKSVCQDPIPVLTVSSPGGGGAGNPCSTGIRWGVSPAAQMGCLRNRSRSPSAADQP